MQLPYVSMLAAMKAGAAYFALDTALPANHLRHMLTDSKPVAVLSAGTARFRLERDVLPPVGATGRPAVLDVVSALALGLVAAPVPPAGGDGSRLCYLMYTSGSTGLPKACAIEHRSIVNLVVQESLLWPIEPADRVLQVIQPHCAAMDIASTATCSHFGAIFIVIVVTLHVDLQAGSFSFDMSLEEIWFAFCNGASLVVADDVMVRAGPAFADWLQVT